MHEIQFIIIIPRKILRGPEFSDKEDRGLFDIDSIRKEIFQESMEEIVEFWGEEMTKQIQKISACIRTPDYISTLEVPSHWDTSQAAQLLLNTLSEIFFPDVSSLPLLEVAELREKAKDELNPMRAEMLRLTQDLRQMVKDESSEEEVAREARNLIKTRVEPVVREAVKYISEQQRTRLRRFFKKGFKAICLGGFGYFSVNLNVGKEALKESVGAVAELAIKEEKHRPPTVTAHFVLGIRQ